MKKTGGRKSCDTLPLKHAHSSIAQTPPPHNKIVFAKTKEYKARGDKNRFYFARRKNSEITKH